MTEERANNKWCPMVQDHKSAANRYPFRETVCCIASECMMWVFDSTPPETKVSHGHCGLAK